MDLPGSSPDLNPIERLWDWTGGELDGGCQAFIRRINQNPIVVVDRRWPELELDPEYEEQLSPSG